MYTNGILLAVRANVRLPLVSYSILSKNSFFDFFKSVQDINFFKFTACRLACLACAIIIPQILKMQNQTKFIFCGGIFNHKTSCSTRLFQWVVHQQTNSKINAPPLTKSPTTMLNHPSSTHHTYPLTLRGTFSQPYINQKSPPHFPTPKTTNKTHRFPSFPQEFSTAKIKIALPSTKTNLVFVYKINAKSCTHLQYTFYHHPQNPTQNTL